MKTASVGNRPPLSPSTVQQVVVAVLEGEKRGPAEVTVTFLTPPRMRALNRQSLNHDRVTDVIAFRLDHDDRIVGDIYVCAAEAQSSARTLGISSREELIRLVVHGTLHVLGFDHPAGGLKQRAASAMWRRQERYVRRFVETA